MFRSKRQPVVLVNPNRMRPPIAPIALDYLSEALIADGFEPRLCDLAFAKDWQAEIRSALSERPVAVGVTVRNLDDCYMSSQDFVLDQTAEIIRAIRDCTEAPIVLGGVGFSIAPREVLLYTSADFGVVHDGEITFPRLLRALARGATADGVAGTIRRIDTKTARLTAPDQSCYIDRISPSRRFVNNSRYFSEGGQIGIETKRGCNQPCIYCCDPPGKGFRVRQRRARTVVEEFEDLIEQGIDVFHLCDSEFNVPASHALEVCNALETNAIGKRARWYTYANPFGFNAELANAMARAGCVGINFGIDHADPDMLKRLGRRHTVQDLESVAEACREAGLVAMFDMLLGGPGETRDSIRRALETLQSIGPDRVGLSCGVRLYPATPLGRFVRGQGPPRDNPNLHGTLIDNDDFLKPIFYVNEAVGDDIQRYVWSLVKGDRRFVIADPDEGNRNYNYNDNSVLEQAIRSGARGAYWHILQQLGA